MEMNEDASASLCYTYVVPILASSVKLKEIFSSGTTGRVSHPYVSVI